MFDPNGGLLYFLVVLVIVFIIAESVYFLLRAWKRAKELNMDMKVVRKAAASSALFTIAPAISILLGVIALSKGLGLPLPWLRLSVIGSLTYETTAAAAAAAAQGLSLSNLISDPKAFNTIAWVMTIGIIPGLVFVPLFGKRIENGMTKIKSKDGRWGEIFQTSLFLGMISAFLGVVFATVGEGLPGWIPVFVMLASAIIMAVCGICAKVLKWSWMENYALPLSMLGAMALSLPITNLVLSIAG